MIDDLEKEHRVMRGLLLFQHGIAATGFLLRTGLGNQAFQDCSVKQAHAVA